MSGLSAYQRRMAAVVAGASPQRLADDAADPSLTWRAAVYRNTFAAGCRDALAGTYPAVRAIVGGEFFHALAQAYIAEHPPSQRSLVGYGQAFPAFLREFPPAAELPYLADVAELDRAWMAAHTAHDAPPLTAAEAAQLDEAQGLAAATLALHPSVRRVAVEWTLYPLWAAARRGIEPDESALQLDRAAETVLVWRPGYEVRHRRLTAGEASFLAHVDAGAPLADAAEAASETDPEAELASVFAALLQDGALADPAHVPSAHAPSDARESAGP